MLSPTRKLFRLLEPCSVITEHLLRQYRHFSSLYLQQSATRHQRYNSAWR